MFDLFDLESKIDAARMFICFGTQLPFYNYITLTCYHWQQRKKNYDEQKKIGE